MDVVWNHQNEDGGWSMLDFYTFENWAAASRPRGFLTKADFDDPPSDGHMTGLAQRESGRWWTRSPNTDNYHFVTYSATAYALVALHKAGRLKRTQTPAE